MGKFLKKEKSENSFVKNSKNFFSKVKERFSFLKWLDPFTYVDLFVMSRVKKITDNELVETGINIFFAAFFAFLFYTLLGIWFGSSTPLVIVYSASMEPNLYRGDIIALSSVRDGMDFGQKVILSQNIKNVPTYLFVEPVFDKSNNLTTVKFSNGQEVLYNPVSRIIVYPAFPSNMPIIHRTIAHISAPDGEFVLTKGDNEVTNPAYDQDCGKIINGRTDKPCITLYAIPVKEIQGVAFFNIPKLGCAKLWLIDDLLSLIFSGKLPSDFRGIC